MYGSIWQYQALAQPVLPSVVVANLCPCFVEPFLPEETAGLLGSFDSPLAASAVAVSTHIETLAFLPDVPPSDLLGSFDFAPPLPGPVPAEIPQADLLIPEILPGEIFGSFDCPFAASVVVVAQPYLAQEPFIAEPPPELLGSFDRPLLYTAEKQPGVEGGFTEQAPSEILGSFDRPVLYTADRLLSLDTDFLQEIPSELLGSFDAPQVGQAEIVQRVPQATDSILEDLPPEILGGFDAPPSHTLDFSPVKDCHIRNGAASATNHDTDNLKVGVGVNTDDVVDRSVLHFDLSGIPVGYRIATAYLAMTALNIEGGGAGAAIFRVTQPDWVENEVTWERASVATDWTDGGDVTFDLSFPWTTPSGSGRFVIPGLAALCNDALVNRAKQLHILLRTSDEGTNNVNVTFRDSEYFLVNDRPVLTAVLVPNIAKLPEAVTPFMEPLVDDVLGSFDRPLLYTSDVLAWLGAYLHLDELLAELHEAQPGLFAVEAPAVGVAWLIFDLLSPENPAELIDAFASPFASNQQVGTREPETSEHFPRVPPDDILGSYDSPFLPTVPSVNRFPETSEPITEQLPWEILGSADRPLLYTADKQPEVVDGFTERQPFEVLGSFDRPVLYTAGAQPAASGELPVPEVPAEVLGSFNAPFAAQVIVELSWHHPTEIVTEVPAELLGSFDSPVTVAIVVQWTPIPADVADSGPTAELLGTFDFPLVTPSVVSEFLPSPSEPPDAVLFDEQLGSWSSPLLASAIGTYNSEGEIRLYTAANWVGVSFAFEVNMRAIAGPVYARMWDRTSSNVVAGSDVSTTATVKTRVRSGALTIGAGGLVDAHEYESQFAKSIGGAGETWGGRPIALP